MFLERLNRIIKAAFNATIDKVEDPSKMTDQYLRNMLEQSAAVKRETAGVMTEEAQIKRSIDKNTAEMGTYADLAKKALTAGNEDDARVFIRKKQQFETAGAELKNAYEIAHANAEKMRQMHDKLSSDIEALKARRETITAKVAVAKTQEKLNEASAMRELYTETIDEAKSLEPKYASNVRNASADIEIAKIRSQLNILAAPEQ